MWVGAAVTMSEFGPKFLTDRFGLTARAKTPFWIDNQKISLHYFMIVNLRLRQCKGAVS